MGDIAVDLPKTNTHQSTEMRLRSPPLDNVCAHTTRSYGRCGGSNKAASVSVTRRFHIIDESFQKKRVNHSVLKLKSIWAD